MREWARLAFKLQRFELLAIGVTLAVLSTAMIVFAWQLNDLVRMNPNCFGSAQGAPQCPDVLDAFILPSQIAENLLRLSVITPLVAIILGVPIVAREIESGTAQGTWALASSRTRWAVGRSLPIVIALAVALGIVGWAAEGLAAARVAGSTLGFADSDARGLIVPLRGVVAFVLAVLIGAWMGRVLPALLTTVPALIIVLLLASFALAPWRVSESVVLPFGRGAISPGSMVLEVVAILPDGTIIPEDRADGLPEGAFQDAVRVLPPSSASAWILREGATLALISTLVTIAAIGVIRRRRPML